LGRLGEAATSAVAPAIGNAIFIASGGFGASAVLGALVLQRARDRWSADVIVSVGIAASDW
jgi:hypothetical protein